MQKLSNYAILMSCGIQPLQAVIAGLLKMTCVRHNHDSGRAGSSGGLLVAMDTGSNK